MHRQAQHGGLLSSNNGTYGNVEVERRLKAVLTEYDTCIALGRAGRQTRSTVQQGSRRVIPAKTDVKK